MKTVYLIACGIFPTLMLADPGAHLTKKRQERVDHARRIQKLVMEEKPTSPSKAEQELSILEQGKTITPNPKH